MNECVVEIKELRVSFPGFGGSVEAVRGISLEVFQGEIVGLVGESGSGKSVSALTALGMFPLGTKPQVSGSVTVLGKDVLSMSERQLESLRGSQIALVPQEPLTSLNPTIRVGRQLSAVIRAHRSESAQRAMEIGTELLSEMMIEDPLRVMGAYPFELSGGLRQRVVLAMAFACNPKVLIADEPTSALDVTVQKEVLDLLAARARASGASILMITHDMGVVRYICDRLYVMLDGRIVESGDPDRLLSHPEHAYTKRLLNALPERTARRHLLPVE